MASLYCIKGILILDNDGERILCKVKNAKTNNTIYSLHIHIYFILVFPVFKRIRGGCEWVEQKGCFLYARYEVEDARDIQLRAELWNVRARSRYTRCFFH